MNDEKYKIGDFVKKNRKYFIVAEEEPDDTIAQQATRQCSLVIQEACDIIDRQAEEIDNLKLDLDYFKVVAALKAKIESLKYEDAVLRKVGKG